jgi:protein-S-isoprenylcysteine O-methyltransferase Ste14
MGDTVTSLKARAIRRLVITLAVIVALLFGSAGSLRFWQGWAFLFLMAAFWIFFLVDLLKHDPKLVERRLQRHEAEPAQKLFQKLFSLVFFSSFVVTGLDFRFGWSRAWLGPVPVALVAAGQAATAMGYWFVFWVMKTNSFAASTIQVEAEQRVINIGPYKFVRHPMYLGMILTALATPLALGSYAALPVYVLLAPVLVFRLIHEERLLRRDLPGYAVYCQQTRFRLVPWIW